MQEKESIMVVRCELKILSLRITVRHHSASLVMLDSYRCDGIFNLHITTIRNYYNLTPATVSTDLHCCRLPFAELFSLQKNKIKNKWTRSNFT